MESSGAPVPVLITFPPSLDSELGRFLVQHYGIRHREQRHTFIISSLATLWHGSTVIFPLLYDEFLRFSGPRAISEYFDSRCAAELRLWPEGAGERQQAESDWTLFNQSLAFATAVFAYYHLLPHRDLMIQPLSQGTPAFEQTAVKRAYPVFAGLLRVLLRLNAQRAQQSLDLIRTIFTAVEARLADGRSYLVDRLVGDRLTISDVAFAVAAAPVVLPSNYGGPIPSFDAMPPAVQAVVTEMRARPAGAFALRIYQEHRDRFGSGVQT
jgi:glutathione S-transferase